MPMALGVLLPDEPKVTQVLFQNGFIEMKPGFNSAFYFRRGGATFAIKGAAGGRMHEQESNKADYQQEWDEQKKSAQEVHSQTRVKIREPSF